ncbi:hypothetical protein TNCT_432211 [Trichonephila clavata]|uniref:Uncharacterized protein n=1 Tax=Trichonephila clavata TaxID=2740835 RepID=A0A8X6F779_TRICU|nr:hypothetical protein TNCT_432211 [Trichonephila clavata]
MSCSSRLCLIHFENYLSVVTKNQSCLVTKRKMDAAHRTESHTSGSNFPSLKKIIPFSQSNMLWEHNRTPDSQMCRIHSKIRQGISFLKLTDASIYLSSPESSPLLILVLTCALIGPRPLNLQ